MMNLNNRIYIISMKCINSVDWVYSSMLIIAEINILHKWEINDLNKRTVLVINVTEYSNDNLTMNWLKHFVVFIVNKKHDV